MVLCSFLFLVIVGLYRRSVGYSGSVSWDKKRYESVDFKIRKPLSSFSPNNVEVPDASSHIDLEKTQVDGENRCLETLQRMYPDAMFSREKLPNGDVVCAYSKLASIACIFLGRQYVEFLPHFHKTQDDWNRHQSYVINLRTYCSQNNIRLLEVPSNISSIESFISTKI